MLFNRNKYSYLSMVMQYIKLVPGMAIMKIIYNIINAVIPTVYIILTAFFFNGTIWQWQFCNQQNCYSNCPLTILKCK